MGNRGPKSDSYIPVKEQRVDGFSVLKKYSKVYSKCQGNLVFLPFIKYVNTIVESIPGILVYSKAALASLSFLPLLLRTKV